MSFVFADTGYWIALIDAHDTLHEKALTISRSLGTQTIVTTELVLVELLNHFAGYGPNYRRVAAQTVQRLSEHPSAIVVEMDTARFAQSVTRYLRYQDKGWGLTDCYSFTQMDDMNMTDALAYDKHFQQAGYRALLRE